MAGPGRPPKKSSTELGTRFVLAREALGYLHRKDFAKSLGIPAESLGKYERGETRPTTDLLRSLRLKHGLDLNWIATGEGVMFDEVTKKTGGLMPDALVNIPRYAASASAGAGILAITDDAVGQIALDRAWFSEIGMDPGNAGVIVAKGDSMEQTISDGTPMVVDFSVADAVSGRIYVISVDGELLVKRLERTIEGNIRLTSDNPKYAPIEIDPARYDALNVVGAVRFILKTM